MQAANFTRYNYCSYSYNMQIFVLFALSRMSTSLMAGTWKNMDESKYGKSGFYMSRKFSLVYIRISHFESLQIFDSFLAYFSTKSTQNQLLVYFWGELYRSKPKNRDLNIGPEEDFSRQ